MRDSHDKKDDILVLDVGNKSMNLSDLPNGENKLVKEGEKGEHDDDDDESAEEDDYDESEKTNDFIRSKKILRDVFPTFLFSVVQLVQETIVLQFVGHYCGSSEFAAVGN